MNDSQKIEELLHHFRMEQRDFAEKCGFDSTSISNIKREKHGISKKISEKILNAFPEINKVWLATGEGEMIRNNVNPLIQGSKNVQTGNIIVGSNVDGDGNTVQHTIPSEDNISYLKQIIQEKDERIKEKDNLLQDMTKRYDKLQDSNDKLQERLFELQDKLLQSQETLLSYIKTDK